MTYLGTNPDLWPQDRLINLPRDIDVQGISKRIAEAVRIAEHDKPKATQMIRGIDEALLKRWFVDVAQHAGKWRVTHNPRCTENRNVQQNARKNPPRHLIKDLFRRDRCLRFSAFIERQFTVQMFVYACSHSHLPRSLVFLNRRSQV